MALSKDWERMGMVDTGGSTDFSNKINDGTPSESTAQRRRILKTVGGGLTAMTIAGCSGDSGDDTITVGQIGPEQIDPGLGAKRSAEIAVDQINENGGILDRDVELVTADTGADPSQGNSEARKLVNQENIDVLVGPYISEVALSIMDFMGETNVPYLVSGAGTPRITRGNIAEDYERHKNTFRVTPLNSIFQARELGEYTEFLSDTHGWNSFALVFEDAAWSQPSSNILPGKIRDAGMEVAMNERIAVDTSDFTPILDSIESSGADVMMKGIAIISGPGLLSTWRQNEYPFSQDGINISSTAPEYWDDTDGGCLYETIGWVSGGAGSISITDKTVPFADAYQSRYDSRPSLPMYPGMGTVDAINIYKNAVESAGTADHENELDSIVDAFLQTDYTGVTGRVQFFRPDHEFPHDVKPGADLVPFMGTQWQETDGGGAKEAVFPEKYKTADHIAPPWMS